VKAADFEFYPWVLKN